MRPKTVTVVSGNSPYYIPTNYRGGSLSISATPAGAGNYDVAYTLVNVLADGIAAATWTDITDMSAATAAATAEVGSVCCLRITLNSGTSVAVSVTQSDV